MDSNKPNKPAVSAQTQAQAQSAGQNSAPPSILPGGFLQPNQSYMPGQIWGANTRGENNDVAQKIKELEAQRSNLSFPYARPSSADSPVMYTQPWIPMMDPGPSMFDSVQPSAAQAGGLGAPLGLPSVAPAAGSFASGPGAGGMNASGMNAGERMVVLSLLSQLKSALQQQQQLIGALEAFLGGGNPSQ